MQRVLVFLLLGSFLFQNSLSAQSTNQFEFLDGDRVVLLGDTLIERDQSYGYIEYLLTTHFPDRNVTFRNLGWSADTPAGISRAGFDGPEKGFDRIKEQLEAFKPNVAFIGYGMANSFEGEAGLPKFRAEMEKLMDTIQQIAGETKVRFVLLSPIPHEKLPPPLPDPAKHNEQLALYTKEIKELAAKRNAWFINLFGVLGNPKNPSEVHITDDGIHLTDYGYRRAMEVLPYGLKWRNRNWRAGITRDGKVRNGTYGIKVSQIDQSMERVKFTALEDRLAYPPWRDTGPLPLLTAVCRIQFIMKPGSYEFRIDGKSMQQVNEKDCVTGLEVTNGPPLDQAEELRQAILKKNELFFHRWRPENNTYLFLFRKYEQGQNAKEIPQFDPLIQAEEKKIAQLRKPVQHTFEVVPLESTNAPATTNSSSATNAPAKTNAPPPEPKKTAAAAPAPSTPLPVPELELEPGFEISVWAENPLLAKPIQINFDPQGRLWVASSSVYPQISPGQVANDKILILEDADGTGKATKSTVFADGLLIPTGVEPGDGGAYVGQSTELLHFKDTDGDGKADQRRVVLSGFGTEDTHHILHTLHWGQDGQLYMNQSIYIHSHLETPHGVVRLNSGGTLSLRPATMAVDIFMKGLVNPWGHQMDEFGQSFATDGAGGLPPNGIFYVLPGGMYSTYAGARRTLGSISPGSYPKFCGLEIIRSEHFPREWQGNMITCDFRANRIVRFGVEEQGSAYVTHEMPDLIRTRNVSFRPIDVKLGPDGALYIADWSNPIIQHGEVDFRDPRRDHEHGRIWRLTAKGRALVKKPALLKAGNMELFDELLSPNTFNREKARRVLIERGANTINDLKTWVARQTSERALLEGLWFYQALDLPEPPLLARLLDARDGRVRAAATRVLGVWHDRVPDPVELLAKRIVDDFPRVRLEALRALARIPSVRSAELALSVLDKPMDPFLDYAAWLTINDLAPYWSKAVAGGAWKSEGREKQLEFGLKALEPAQAQSLLEKVIAGKSIPRDGSGGLIELIGQAGGPAELRLLLDAFLKGLDEPAAVRALSALEQAARLRNSQPSGDLDALGKHPYSSPTVHAAALRVVGAWKLSAYAKELLAIAGNQSQPPPLRGAAFGALREIGGADAVAGLRELAGKSHDDATRRQAAVALAAVDLNQSLAPAVEVITSTSQEEEALALWRSLLAIKGAAPALARVLPKTGLPETAARAGLRVAREGGRSEPELVIALARAAGLNDDSQNLTDAELAQIAAQVKSGDPARGESIYRRKELGCMVCHAIGGAGGRVGPDLTSIGASAQIDYLVESVLAPNKKVKEGYHSIQVTTKDGQELSGIPVRETSEELVLRDTTNKEMSIPLKNIESRKTGGSIMPAGLVDFLSPGERLDLFRFLSELGKPGPYDATHGHTARVWRVNPSSARPGDLLKSDLSGPGWLPVYSTLSGALLKADLETELSLSTRRDVFFAATRFQTAKAGPVKLVLDGLNSPKAWLDGRPVGDSREMIADVAAGTHTFLLKLDPSSLPDQIKLQTSDATFLVE